MYRIRPYHRDLLALLVLVGLPLLWFSPVLFPTFSGKTLLPYDNLYSFEPWRSLRPDLVPHNNLLSDLVLENAVWKLHIQRTFANGSRIGRLPLWNPQIFTGIPFLAAGQASTFYPLSILFYILPLEAAYGWFTAIQIALAGINMYLLGRVLRLHPISALFSGVVFMFSGFLIVSVVFTMFIAAVVWLPLLLAIIERIICKQEEKGVQSFRPIPYIVAGIAVIGMMILAGHPELIYYTLLVAGAYSAARLINLWLTLRQQVIKSQISNLKSQISLRILKLSGWLLVMALLGIAAGAIQLLPLLDLLPQNFREGSVSLAQVREWAWPDRHVITFWIPDIFGNPSHHHWFDLWNQQWIPATTNALGEATDMIFWGIKNYVEGGSYLGIATWLLAIIAIIGSLRPRITNHESRLISDPDSQNSHRFTIWFLAILAVVSLLFAFGTPLYAILFYGLPGWSQLHSPFRWVFPFTLSMALLGGIGLQTLMGLWIRDCGFEIASMQIRFGRLVSIFAVLVGLAGIVALGIVLVSYIVPGPFIDLGQRVVERVDLAQMTFADGRMFWGYQALNLVKFGIFATASGLLVWLCVRLSYNQRNKQSVPSFILSSYYLVILSSLVLLVALDLYLIHGTFNPASPIALSPLEPENIPPAVKFLNDREGIPRNTQHATRPSWRFTTFNLPGEKTFNANVGMYYGWQDIRGYDSTIPRQYVELMNHIAPQANELLYNRIAPLYFDVAHYEILDNPLLDLLNVKYVLTEHYIPNPGWSEIYRDESVGVYENQELVPRAFITHQAQVFPLEQQPLSDTDLTKIVLLEETPENQNALNPSGSDLATANISRYTANDVFIDVNLGDRGWLVLTDAFFPGWHAYLRPFGADENQEEELKIYRANGAFRAIYLPDDGQWTVRFVYSPMSFKLGLYVSFLALMTASLLLLWWGWGRYYKPETTESEVRTVAKNSLVPMTLNLSNKAIDFAFTMLYVRLLGPEGTGKYYFVVAIYGLFEIISRYGLGTLLTRDVAADKNQSSRYLTNVLAVRTLLWLVTVPIMALVTYGYTVIGNTAPSTGAISTNVVQAIALLAGIIIFTIWGDWLGKMFGINPKGFRIGIWVLTLPLLVLLLASDRLVDAVGRSATEIVIQSIGREEVQAIAILALAMLFANWSDALSNLFNAFEKMEYTAGLTSAMSLLRVALGALALFAGFGFVGLAWVSLIVNVVGLVWIYSLLRNTLFQPEWHWDWSLQKWMMNTSGPLMINHLLATIFWRIDIWILRPLSAASVGLYSVGIKYLDGLNIIPSIFTMAVFPLMSRYAQREGEHLLRAYTISVRLLIMISLPIAMSFTFLAEPLVWLVGGGQFVNRLETVSFLGHEFTFLGGANLALQVVIWSIPIGFINSVTQFVLIAVNQQRYLTKAFILGVVFNTVGNLLLISNFGYLGAAFVTILSEFSLLFPFYYSVKRHVGVVSWASLIASPVLSTIIMGTAIFGFVGLGTNAWIAVTIGWVVYIVMLTISGGFRGEDMATIGNALPLGPLKRLLPVSG